MDGRYGPVLLEQWHARNGNIPEINYSGNINDLPKDKQALVNKKPVFRSDEAMISEGLQKITRQMGDNILAYFK